MREALCSTLHLEKAIAACIQAAPSDFPIDGIFLNYYRDDIQSMQFLALATRRRSRAKLNVLSIPIHVLSKFIVRENFTTTILNRLSDDPLTEFVIKHHFRKVKSAIVMRLKVDDIRLGAVIFFSYRANAFNAHHAELAESLRGPFSLLASRALSQLKIISEETLKASYTHRASMQEDSLPAGVIATQKSPMASLFMRLPDIAKSQRVIVIKGEKGSGKSLLAHHLYQQSDRSQQQLAVLYAETLTLFIHRDGQATEARTLTPSSLTDGTLLAQVNSGTLLIENVESLPEELLCNLMKSIRIHKEKGWPTSVIITRTQSQRHQINPEALLSCECYCSLYCLSVTLLPLRQRREDIPELVTYYLLKLSQNTQHRPPLLSVRFQQSLLHYEWPGNIAELIARLEKALLACSTDVLDVKPEEYVQSADDRNRSILPLDEIVRRHIIETLRRTNGKISGEGGAAQMLQVNSNTLYSKMKKLGITRDIYAQ